MFAVTNSTGHHAISIPMTQVVENRTANHHPFKRGTAFLAHFQRTTESRSFIKTSTVLGDH